MSDLNLKRTWSRWKFWRRRFENFDNFEFKKEEFEEEFMMSFTKFSEKSVVYEIIEEKNENQNELEVSIKNEKEEELNENQEKSIKESRNCKKILNSIKNKTPSLPNFPKISEFFLNL